MKFYKNEFMEYMKDTFFMDNFARWLLESVVKYGEKHNNVTKYQIVYFIYDILKEAVPIEYTEVEQFYR